MRKITLQGGAIEMIAENDAEKEIASKAKMLKTNLKDKKAGNLSNAEVKDLVYVIGKTLGII